MMESLTIGEHQLDILEPDPHTRIFYLRLPAANLVLFQGYFENWEGLGVVRTEDREASIISIITTPSSLSACLEMLTSVKSEIAWAPAAVPDGKDPSIWGPE